MSVHFILLAYRTSLDELIDIGSQSWPPEVSFEEGLGAKSAGMPKGWGGVEGGYKGVMGIWWDVHLSLKIKVASFICPVFYRGTRE